MEQAKAFFLLTKQELDILEKAALFEPWLIDNIDGAKKKGDQYIVNIHTCDIGETLGAIAYSAECTEIYTEKEAYIALHDKIKEKYLHSKNSRRFITENQIRKQLGE